MESQCPPFYVRPAASDALIEPTDCHAAHFATRWLRPSLAVISAHGELDAANAQEFVDYALRHAAHIDCLVLYFCSRPTSSAPQAFPLCTR